jgi:hypothetical protein
MTAENDGLDAYCQIPQSFCKEKCRLALSSADQIMDFEDFQF